MWGMVSSLASYLPEGTAVAAVSGFVKGAVGERATAAMEVACALALSGPAAACATFAEKAMPEVTAKLAQYNVISQATAETINKTTEQVAKADYAAIAGEFTVRAAQYAGVTNETALSAIKAGTQSAVNLGTGNYAGLATTAIEQGAKFVGASDKLKEAASTLATEGVAAFAEQASKAIGESTANKVVTDAATVAMNKVAEKVLGTKEAAKQTEPSPSVEKSSKSESKCKPLTKDEVTKQADEISQGTQQKAQAQGAAR